MVRKIIQIDEELCNGCGACVKACHEGAIGMVDGKAKLLRDDYCDGLGDCLPNCPVGAITFVKREAAAYDEAAVLAHKAKQPDGGSVLHAGCPGQAARTLDRHSIPEEIKQAVLQPQLAQWPCQIKLAPIHAPYFDGADLLIAADCTAFAFAGMHQTFMKGKITLIGCPKLDAVDYSEKLSEIIQSNEIRSVTVVRMEVPCCGGLQAAAHKAVQSSKKTIPWQVVTITTDGRILK
ncbi:MAG: 4Fe-4S binding protein [Eubacterium sp.]|nr:4Fe-4S binding protein [Eubacterium sp.]